MFANDIIRVKGHLLIKVLDAKSGRELDRVDKPNLVCKNSKVAITQLLAQRPADNPSYDKMWAIYVGDSNTAPTTDQIALQGTVVAKKAVDQPIEIISPSDSGIIEVEMTLLSGEANGSTLREAALYTRGDNDDPTSTSGALMLARQVHADVTKTSGIVLSYTWRYQITV